MSPEDSTLRQRLVMQWDELIGVLGNQSPGCSVRPDTGWQSISRAEASHGSLARFSLSPIVLNVPERANHSSPNLYVVVRGWLELVRAEFSENDLLITHAFSTEAGYFILKDDRFEHVYGAHYDASHDSLGHPVFHAQMKSFIEFADEIRGIFSLGQLHCEDRVKGVLKNVRVPTAQMDFFALVLQVFADHLLFDKSGLEEKETFNGLLVKSQFLKGAGRRYPRLQDEEAISCYRSLHWYPIVA